MLTDFNAAALESVPVSVRLPGGLRSSLWNNDSGKGAWGASRGGTHLGRGRGWLDGRHAMTSTAVLVGLGDI
ncbi:MAG TPA: hypothetical protein VM328_06325, partial [Fimbriimonadaceae bacterium]|nr:hypothetical protein [Fimbriimonadaceae bacterium]